MGKWREKLSEIFQIEEVDHPLSSICPICMLARAKKHFAKEKTK